MNKKSSGSRFRKQRLTAVGNRCANHVTPLYPQKLALTSPTGGGRSVGMVRSRTKATEFSLVFRLVGIATDYGLDGPGIESYQRSGPYTRLSTTGTPKTGCGNMDRDPSSSIPSPNSAMPVSYRLYRIPAASPLERLPPSTQDTHSRKVLGCATVAPSPSTPDSFKAGLKGDSMAPYIFGQQTPPIPSRTHHG